MLKKIGIALVVVLLGLCALIAMQPATYTVTRTSTVNAPAPAVFALVNDFHKWDVWSPWAKIDPNMKATYSGSPEGTGAVYHWVGNDDVGEGRMTITESQPTQRVRINLEFLKPFESKADTNFSFTPSGEQTQVAWTMSGDNNFMSKAMCLFMGGMDKMIGPDFEKGLAAMKAAAERK